MLPFVIGILFGLIAGAARAQSCRDIGQFDFSDATIPIAARDERGHSGPDFFRLHHGIGFLSDDPDSPQSHDWRLGLLVDRLQHPDASNWIRVIVVDKSHLTGTGDWHYVLAFDCKNGSLSSVFQYAAEGVALQHLSDQTLDLYQAIWTKDDAHCCPGRHLSLVYKWNTQQHGYKIASSTSAPEFESVPDEK